MDQLLAAQFDENPEISLAAQHLVGQLTLQWAQPNDPAIVGFVLKGYQRLSSSERRSRALWIGQLEDGIGIDALCRIVRYERSEVLAKLAALHLMQFMDVEDTDQRHQLVAATTHVLGDSQRRPAQWLRTFQQGLEEPREALVHWQRFVDEELELPRKGPNTSQEIAASLIRWCADQAINLNELEYARKSISRCVDLQKDQPRWVLENAHWLLDHGQWRLWEELIIDQFPELVAENPQFTYGSAEAAHKQGNIEGAAELAEKAFAMTDEKVHIAANPLDTIWIRSRAAIGLEDRGLTEWSIREYRRIAAMETPHWRMVAIKEQAVQLLAELLHDRQRDREAADVLSKLLKSSRTIRFSRGRNSDWANVISRMHFFRSEEYRQQANREEQMSHLRQGIEADPTDADVLIAMYRLPRADDAWVESTQQRIRQAVDIFAVRLKGLRGTGVIANRYKIATELNQIAWLVGNTVGDYEQAIAQSRRSLELRPRSAGSLDTLGRTYFSEGDVTNALKYQRRAVKLEPHSQQIRRQLLEFEQARSKK